MFFLVANGQDRPTILEKVKSEKYHIDFARYCLGQANNQHQNNFANKVAINKKFYTNNSWIKEEDLDLFFKDDTDQGRNRIKMRKNIIRPMVEQYRGNAIRMGINFKVKSISSQAINRRENTLARMLHFSNIANDPNNPWGDDMKKQMAIGNSEGETRAIFENVYVDKYVEKMNYLLGYISDRNKFSDKQVRLSEELALTGMAVMGEYEYSGHQQFEIVPSENFFFDRSAKEYDLSDAEFMGEVLYMTTSEIFEQYPDLDDPQRAVIENYAKQYRKAAQEASVQSHNGVNNQQFVNSGKVPVYKTYWKDGDVYEYGYVLDKFGYEYLTRINHIEEGDEKPRYTDNDLIRSNSERAKRLLNGKLKRRLHMDTLRMAIFIPNEIISIGGQSGLNEQKNNDILLEWGVAPYQETENLDFDSVKFPYKCYCWGYVDGEVLSPIDDAIDPQRFINRIMSIAENQINNSRGSGTVIDSSMVDDEGEVVRNMNQSKPIFIKAKGRGVQNAVSQYDSTVKAGTMVLFNIIDSMGKLIQDVTGVNEALKGESTGSDQLVGVTQLLIQRGSLMQEPFYNAITNVYKQCYESAASKGKRIYADNERNLCIAVGDEGADVIKITKDMKLEDFRCFIKRQNSDEMLVESGNQMLMALFSIQLADGSRLLDEKRFANLYGRSTPDEIGIALRQAAKEKEEIQRMRSESANKQMIANEEAATKEAQEMKAEQEHAMFSEQARQEIDTLGGRKHEIEKEHVKNLGKIAANNPDAQKQIINYSKNLDKQLV
jgi:hypothetical protein